MKFLPSRPFSLQGRNEECIKKIKHKCQEIFTEENRRYIEINNISGPFKELKKQLQDRKRVINDLYYELEQETQEDLIINLKELFYH